tara:strand:+ start:1792 stop:2919 length:1128 start_codon:yes stop_codon:yes gene_type:complete
MIIPTNPFIKKLIKPLEKNTLVFPWDRAFFSNNGTTAIILTLKELGIKKGSSIGVPAYICNSVPNSLIKYGYKPIYFDIEKNLIPKNEILNELIDKKNIKALILIEYFGLFCNQINSLIKEVKDKNKLKIILDRCHSSFSGDFKTSQLSKIDAIVYSHRKTVRVVDGGCHFILSEPNVPKEHEIKNISRFSLFYFFSYLEKIIYHAKIINLYSELIYKLRKLLRNFLKNKYADIKLQKNSQISNHLYSILSDKNHVKNIIEKRKSNYNFLINKLSKYEKKYFKLIRKKLGKNETPQILPLLDTKGGLVAFLRNHGIAAYHWPDFELPDFIRENKNVYSNSHNFNKSLVCIPIHQSLKIYHLEHINKTIIKWLAYD